MKQLLTTNTKLLKGDGLPCYGLQLAPHTLSGYNVCPMASDRETPANLDECLDVLECGGRVAVPFTVTKKTDPLPTEWQGYPVVDGDEHDRIWTHPKGVVLGLRFKGDKGNMAGGCKDYCIYSSGHGRFDGVKGARLYRTRLLHEARALFFDQLTQELDALTDKHPEGVAVRLNVFSDLTWEANYHPGNGKTLFDLYPQVTFYDYTKVTKRMHRYLAGTIPSNYTLVYSYNKVWDVGT